MVIEWLAWLAVLTGCLAGWLVEVVKRGGEEEGQGFQRRKGARCKVQGLRLFCGVWRMLCVSGAFLSERSEV